ncbi:hypothetical protein DVH05_000973 [Phytophthora capsici]|nr:hypothetical protein DVH05_000973 [Phytophthora capsici]|eukprot:jgi/Phyca11/133426/e_gw1.466.1.1
MTSSVPRQLSVDLLRQDATLRQKLNELEKQRQKQHSVAMVVYRKAKKEKQQQIRRELHHLERQLKQLVKNVRASAARSSQDQDVKQTSVEVLRGLVAEQKLLRIENLALREEIGRKETFRVLLNSEPIRKELSQIASSRWRVEFDRNVPCFHFSPFTRSEFDEKMNQFDLELALSLSSLSFAGEFLGWSVHRAPLATSTLGFTVARVRLAKRVRCPFHIALDISYMKAKDMSPIIVSPVGFGINQCHLVSKELLQEFDQDALVFAHHIPDSEKTLRYICFIRRARWKLQDGRRNFEFSMAIVNSPDIRDAEGLQENVEWVEEGGMNISMTEVDGTFMDIVCDRWASCQGKLQVDYNMVQWAQYVSWWEQTLGLESLLL